MRGIALLALSLSAGCAASSPKALVIQDAAKPAATAEAAPAEPDEEAWHGHVPIGFWNSGICLGNSKDWNGLRLNWSDEDLGTINGANVTLWDPDGSPHGSVNGVGLGLVGNGAAHLRGIFARR